MVKLFIYILLLLLFGGCSAFPAVPETDSQEGRMISVNISNPPTRSFSGTAAETWEKKINTAAIYIFAPSGKTIHIYTLKTTEITAINNNNNTSISFIVPGNLVSCDLYFLANTTPPATVATKAALQAAIEQDIGLYNGTYASVSTTALRTNGFVMTGSVDGVALNPSGSASTTVNLKRIVAKVAVEVNFTAVLNLGTITMNSITLSQTAPNSYLFHQSAGYTGGTATNFIQAPQVDANNSKKFRSFFYIYENDTRSGTTAYPTVNISGSGLLLIISTPFAYNVRLTGDGNGKFSRNTGYYIVVNITKLTTILLTKSGEDPGYTVEEKRF